VVMRQLQKIPAKFGLIGRRYCVDESRFGFRRSEGDQFVPPSSVQIE
jgi:hypothetical protein